MTAEPINLHAWPGRGDVARIAPSREAPRSERFGDRGGIVLVAAAERYRIPETWGLGIALAVNGPTIAGATLIVADDLDQDRLDALRAWARSAAIATPSGRRQVKITTRTAWCDPEGSGLIGCYRGGRWFVTGDGARSLGLLSAWWGPALGRFRGGFSLGFPGWGEYATWTDRKGRKRSGWRPRLHEPPMRAKAIGAHGMAVEWARAGRRGLTPDGEPAGHWEGGRPFRGRIVDLIGPAHAFDGLDTGDLGDHLAAFGLPALDVPAAVPVTPEGADCLLDVARAVHGLTLTLDAEAARWLVTPDDLREGKARLTLRAIVSPGSVATAILDRSGVTPPLRKFGVPDDADLDRWQGGAHGGWCTSDLRGEVVPVYDADERQAYPTDFTLLGCWAVLTARQLRRVDVTDKLRGLCEQAAAGDFTPLYERGTYRDLGLTLAEVLPDGEPWPVERPGKGGPRFDVAPLRSPVALPVAWADVVLAAALSGRVPRIVSATKLLPVGTEEGLRPIPLRDGLVVPAGEDPIPWLVRLRPEKGTGEDRLRDCIRGAANPAGWGLFGRLDQYRVGGTLRERVARWSWPPVAASVPAVARLWLGVAERQVRDLGGSVIARDTDGISVVASPAGGAVELRDGRTIRALSWPQVDDLLRPFDRLDPFGDGKPAWSVDREHDGRPLHMLSLGPKRYVLCTRDDTGRYVAVGGTEHSLGGGVVDPPAMRGRDEDRRHMWTLPVAQRAIDLASGTASGWVCPWDQAESERFPVLRRLAAGSPDALRDLPADLRVHPFAPLVEGQPDKLYGDPGAPVALDPGTDLADWQRLDWRDGSGDAVRLGVRPGPGVDVVLRVLDEWALRWCAPLPSEPDGLVEVTARLIRRVGRGGALIDALLADPEARAEDHQVTYNPGDPGGFVRDLARRIGPRPVARATGLPLKTCERLALGSTSPDEPTIRTVLDAVASGAVAPTRCAVCGADVWRPGATYCSPSCRETAKARRHRGAGGVVRGVCALPGCRAPARVRSSTCSEAHRKALTRLRDREGDAAVEPDDGTFYWRPTLDPVTGLAIGPRPDWIKPRAVPATPMPWEDTFPEWEHFDEPEPVVETFPDWAAGYAPSDRWGS
ncbi:MAG: hypothetical protein M0Z46_21105 [Actinomycetota bacterium]|nr:hypothetical protein [Actinomycetota bacterium]